MAQRERYDVLVILTNNAVLNMERGLRNSTRISCR